MNPVTEVGQVVRRELKKNVTSVKGGIVFALALLGASAATRPLPKLDIDALDSGSLPSSAIHDMKAAAFARLYDNKDTGGFLADAPTKLVVLFFLAVWIAPLLITIIGFDALSGELQHRTVRYVTVRTRRASYYTGKALGLFSTVALLTLFMHGLIWVFTIARGEASAADTVSWGGRFWLASLPITAAWCSLATLVGSLFRTPVLALLATGATFFVMFFFGWAIARSADIRWLTFIYPNSYDSYLVSPDASRVMIGLASLVAICAVSVAAGSALFARRDV